MSCGDNAGYVKIPSSVPLVRRTPIGVTRIVITRNGFKRTRSSVCKPKPDSNVSLNIPCRIALHLSQRPTGVRRAGDTHGGAIVLRMVLGAVPTQEQSPQIRHSPAQHREQFRVGSLRAGNARFSLRSNGNQGIHFLHGYPPSVGTAHDSRKGKGGYQPCRACF